MKTHQELRKMAAEFEAEKLRAQGRDVVVGSKPDHSATNPHHPNNVIPVIFDRSTLEQYEHEKAKDPSTPSPIPILDFSAWTYKARCPDPECGAALIKLDLKLGEAPKLATPATCLRVGCGWSGTNDKVLRTCLTCGEVVPGVVDAVCPACRKRKRAKKKTTEKSASKG